MECPAPLPPIIKLEPAVTASRHGIASCDSAMAYKHMAKTKIGSPCPVLSGHISCAFSAHPLRVQCSASMTTPLSALQKGPLDCC